MPRACSRSRCRGESGGARTLSPSAQRPCRSAHASYSRCQTAHPPSLTLRRASEQARHSLGVGGQSSSFPRRVSVRGFLPSASRSPPRMRGGGAPEAGHWHFRRACEARRLASRATGGRLSALQRGDFRPRDRRFVSRQCPPESAPRLRRRLGSTPGRSGLAPPVTAVRSASRDATSPLSPQGISGDAPHERGWRSL
jgi:hypothetical protein